MTPMADENPTPVTSLNASDAKLIRSLTRQLRTIKLMLGFFFVLFVVVIAMLGYMTYKVITFTNDVTTKITNFQNQTTESLNVKKQICDNKTFRSFLDDKSEVCK